MNEVCTVKPVFLAGFLCGRQWEWEWVGTSALKPTYIYKIITNEVCTVKPVFLAGFLCGRQWEWAHENLSGPCNIYPQISTHWRCQLWT